MHLISIKEEVEEADPFLIPKYPKLPTLSIDCACSSPSVNHKFNPAGTKVCPIVLCYLPY